jgi:hypothetical protein
LPFSQRSEVVEKKKKKNTIKPEMNKIPEIIQSKNEEETEEKQEQKYYSFTHNFIRYYDTITSVFDEKRKKQVN